MIKNYVTFKIEHEHNTIQILKQYLTPKYQLCKKINTILTFKYLSNNLQ